MEKCAAEIEIRRKGANDMKSKGEKALISHAVSNVFDVQRGMQGGKSLN